MTNQAAKFDRSTGHVTHLLKGRYGSPAECPTRRASFGVPFSEYPALRVRVMFVAVYRKA